VTRRKRTHARARPISSVLSELLEMMTHAKSVTLMNDRVIWDLPDSYYEARMQRGVWVMDPEDWRRAHAELAQRRDDLRCCPGCGTFFLTAHKRRQFLHEDCRRKYHRYGKKLRDQLRDARQRRNRAEVARIEAALENHERMARPLE
jgi:hypothetical protein